MLTRLGRFTVRHRRLVLSFTVLFIVVAAVLGTRAFGVLEDDGFEDPSSESARAGEILEPRLRAAAEPTRAGGARRPTATSTRRRPQTAGAELHRRGSVPSTASPTVTSYWSLGAPPSLRSDDGDAALIVVVADRRRGRTVVADVRDDRGRPRAADGASTVGVGGGEAVGEDIATTIEGDLARAELDRRPDHAGPAAARVRRAGRRLAAAVRRRHRRPRHVPLAVRDRLDHRRVDLRHQPHHRARPRPGHRLQPVHRVPLPGGAAQRTHRRRRRRPRRRDGRLAP